MDIRMTNRTVENFAIDLDMTPQALLELLKSAGVAKESFEDRLSDADKTRLLDHLRSTRTSACGTSAPKLTPVSGVKRNPKLAQLRAQTQFEFDTPPDTATS